eukprot:22549_1
MSTATNKKLVKSGYMFKRGKLVTSWKNRYFKLYTNGSLQYFSHSENIKPNGIIHISNAVKILKKRSNEIEIITPNRIWNLKTTTQFTRNKWFNVIWMIFKDISFDDIPKQIDIKKVNEMLQNNKQKQINQNTQIQNINADHKNTHINQPFIFHKIKMGETLISLSVKYGVSVNKIKAYNKSLCFGNRLGHISGKMILIPTKTKANISSGINSDNNTADTCTMELEENEKYYKRKAFRFFAKGLKQIRCDYYLQRSDWNVRKAVNIWKMDILWEKNKMNNSVASFSNTHRYNLDMEESMSIMESYEPSISSYFGHIEFDNDGYFRYNLNDNCMEIKANEREISISDSVINDEFIKFRFEHMRDSIEEYINFDKMAEEYEQRKIYEEMMEMERKQEIQKQKVCVLDEEYGIKYQLLCQQYQIQAMQNGNNVQFVQLLQQRLQNGLIMLREEYLRQREIIVGEMENKDKEVNDLRELNLDDS